MYRDNWKPIYINNVLRNVTGYEGNIFADSDKLPNRRCAAYWLPNGSAKHLENGGAIFTSGNRFSLKPTTN